MCRELEVSRSGYYASRTRVLCRRVLADLELVTLIHAEFAKHPRGCGSRMIQGALRHPGYLVSRKRIVRLMSEEGLRPRLKRRFVCTTQSRHDKPVVKNILNRAFAVGATNKVWASDITSIHTRRGWAYLAVTLDLGSRKVVGWCVASSMTEHLPLAPLRAAFQDQHPPHGLIHHSDRGTQYAGHAFSRLLSEHGAISSMSRKGNCWDNACVESFFSTLKRELPNDHVFEDWREVDLALFAYIEAYYNNRRPHSAVGFHTPNEYEELHAAA